MTKPFTKYLDNQLKEAVKKTGSPKLPVNKIVRWPKVGQEVQHRFSNRIGVVLEMDLINFREKVLIDWGLFEKWELPYDLEEVDT